MQFGVITACHRGDYFLAKATCASISHFLPGVGICVIADGDFSLAELEQLYGVKTIRVRDSGCPELRRLLPGSSRAKLLAFWESPFEYFIYLDSDALIWGDFRNQLNWDNFDFISFCRPVPNCYDAESIKRWHFDPQKLALLDPSYNWLHDDYFCAGTFAAKRGVIRLDDYLRVEDWGTKVPDLFKLSDQGILNYLVYKGRQDGVIRVGIADYQHILANYSFFENRRRFPGHLAHLPRRVSHECVIHGAGRKPLIQNLNTFSRPFTACRLAHYSRLHGPGFLAGLKTWMRILVEESVFLRRRIAGKVRRFVRLNP